ncbi:glycosyltransferase family 39 protein [uncultured Sphingomonas sp.]|uniref:glycosyltransferase family 39 protein n=1 Tax=uncultured Sphingomonas sp. TaxID=158754 RepID=UPI0035CBE749
MTADDAPRPLLTALIVALFSEALFLWGVTVPHKPVFDEVHYVPAARILLALGRPTNIEHPLLAKEFIAAGIALFGDNSLGWRFFSTLAGTATVLGVFAILWLLFGRVRPALMGAGFALMNFTVFIQARIAMLDGFLAAFSLLAVAAMLWSMTASRGRAWPRWVLAAILFGLAVAAKWAAMPYVAFAGLGFVIVRLVDTRRAGRPVGDALLSADQPHWPGIAPLPGLLVLGLVSIATYFLTFAPAFFYRSDAMTLAGILPFQAQMYAAQTQMLPAHTYQASWWTWPLMIRPIWYLYENVDGAERGILMIGNPAVLWGGLVAVAACLYGAARDRSGTLLFAALLWIGSYAVWIIIPKSIGFFYYYYLPSIFLCVALAAACDHFARGRLQRWDEAFVGLAFGLTVYFFPIISAAALANDQAFLHWMWLKTWP